MRHALISLAVLTALTATVTEAQSKVEMFCRNTYIAVPTDRTQDSNRLILNARNSGARAQVCAGRCEYIDGFGHAGKLEVETEISGRNLRTIGTKDIPGKMLRQVRSKKISCRPAA